MEPASEIKQLEQMVANVGGFPAALALETCLHRNRLGPRRVEHARFWFPADKRSDALCRRC
eukprot:7330379-Prorocentrum_lima.AAC.1